MKKLFENIGGNQFKLLTEATENSELIRSGLTKVFSVGEPEISYSQLANIGLGYIRNVSEARKCALREAQDLAPQFGYQDDEPNQKFVKEVSWHDEESYKRSHGDTHGETDMSNPEEKREVQIANEILAVIKSPGMDRAMETEKGKLQQLAQELLKMHGAK
jgi:hypothetical protein